MSAARSRLSGPSSRCRGRRAAPLAAATVAVGSMREAMSELGRLGFDLGSTRAPLSADDARRRAPRARARRRERRRRGHPERPLPRLPTRTGRRTRVVAGPPAPPGSESASGEAGSESTQNGSAARPTVEVHDVPLEESRAPPGCADPDDEEDRSGGDPLPPALVRRPAPACSVARSLPRCRAPAARSSHDVVERCCLAGRTAARAGDDPPI